MTFRSASVCNYFTHTLFHTMPSTRRALLAACTVTICVAATPRVMNAQGAMAASAACGRECLLSSADRFVDALLSHRTADVRLTDAAEVRQNTRITPLARTAWGDVRTIRSRLVFADTITGNVITRTGVEMTNGRPAYLSTRLKVLADGRISDVELSVDTSTRVVTSYIFSLNPRLNEVLPPSERMSRDSLDAFGRRYFQALTDHNPLPADFDERCDRFHSGQRVTNSTSNSVEGGPPRTCLASNQGARPWGPAIEQRLSVVDPERGIVIGYTLLLYPNDPRRQRMYVSEIFKVVSGRVILIDNIGLMMPDVATIGFAH
jgi:hypothetical protein